VRLVFSVNAYLFLILKITLFFPPTVEKVHSMMRRYTSPDEHPFFPEKLLRPVLPLLDYPRVIVRNNININHKIKSLYIERILPQICKEGPCVF